MPEAVAIMQPRRVIITFGTNDLSPSNSTENFIESYEKGIKAVEEATPVWTSSSMPSRLWASSTPTRA